MPLTLRTIALCAAAALLSGTAGAADLPMPGPVGHATIHILSAHYGSPTSGRVCDAGASVASVCDGRRTCTFDVRNGLCGDPDFLSFKQVDVTYSCGRDEFSTSAGEYHLSTLTCR